MQWCQGMIQSLILIGFPSQVSHQWRLIRCLIFDQSESLNSESALREHFISNYIMGRQLALSKIDVSSIDMLFFPDQEAFNFATFRFKWYETPSKS